MLCKDKELVKVLFEFGWTNYALKNKEGYNVLPLALGPLSNQGIYVLFIDKFKEALIDNIDNPRKIIG